jgi:RNA polymerase sigma-70 factor (ECF subfamily)
MKRGETVREFEEIYELYFSDIFRYTLALSRCDTVAEEITADTFFKALKKIDSFDGRCDIRTWLCQIAKNTYFTYLKKRGRETEIVPESIASDCTVDVAFEDKETAFRIHKSCTAWTNRTRKCSR